MVAVNPIGLSLELFVGTTNGLILKLGAGGAVLLLLHSADDAPVTSLCTHPTLSLLFAGHANGFIRVYDIKSGVCVRVCARVHGECSSSGCLLPLYNYCTAPCGGLGLPRCADRPLRAVVWCGAVWCGVVWCGVVWCVVCGCPRAGHHVHALKGHAREVTGMAVEPTGKVLATTGNDCVTKWWSVDTQAPLDAQTVGVRPLRCPRHCAPSLPQGLLTSVCARALGVLRVTLGLCVGHSVCTFARHTLLPTAPPPLRAVAEVMGWWACACVCCR